MRSWPRSESPGGHQYVVLTLSYRTFGDLRTVRLREVRKSGECGAVRAFLRRATGANDITSIQRSAATRALLSRLGLGSLAGDEQRGLYRSRAERTVDLAVNFLDDLFLFDWLFQSRDHLGLPPCEWTIFCRPGFRKFTQTCRFPVAIRHGLCLGRGSLLRRRRCSRKIAADPYPFGRRKPAQSGIKLVTGTREKIRLRVLFPWSNANADGSNSKRSSRPKYIQ